MKTLRLTLHVSMLALCVVMLWHVISCQKPVASVGLCDTAFYLNNFTLCARESFLTWSASNVSRKPVKRDLYIRDLSAVVSCGSALRFDEILLFGFCGKVLQALLSESCQQYAPHI